MKTKYISGLLTLTLLIITSCKKELVPQDSSGVNTISTTDSTSASSTSLGMTNSAQGPTLPQQNANSNSVGMNPPHGQAGHRCDIAVGTPLNSTPNKSASVSKSGSNSATPSIIKSNAPVVVTKPGMNPPHGLAGHRCDVAVGAPLNSPSSKVAPVPVVTNPEVPVLLKQDSTATSLKQ